MTVDMVTSARFPQRQVVKRRGYRASLSLALLSSAILASVGAPASAQEVPPATSTTPAAATGGQSGDAQVPIGTVRQPTPDDPGWVSGVTLGEFYTDNLKLAAPGSPKQTSWITQVEPFLKAAVSRPRFSGLVDYRLTGYLYASQSHYDQLTQDLKAQSTVALVPQHLFVDGTALYGSEVINNQQVAAPGTFFLTSNRANVARGTISPHWTQDLGKAGTMNLRYSYGRVVYNTRGISGENANTLSGIPDVTSNALQFSLVSPEYETWGWNLNYSDQRIDPDFGRRVEFATGRVGTYVQVSTTTRLLADGGKESKFLPDGTVDKLGASFWEAGISWANGLNKLKLMVGHRFYGHSYQFSWVRTAALLRTTLSYEEQPTDINQQLLGQNPGELALSPIETPSLPSLRERQPYLMKRAAASAQYQMPRGRLRLTLYDERRTYFTLDNRQEKVANANVDWLFDIGAFTTFTPTVGWQRYQFRDGQVRHRTYEQVALVHQFGPENFISMKLRHQSSTVSSVVPGAHGYGVNVVYLQWTHLF